MIRDHVENGSARTPPPPATIKVRRLAEPCDPVDGIRVLAAFRQPSWEHPRRFDGWCRHLGPPPYVVDGLNGQGEPAIEWEEFRTEYLEYLASPRSQQAIDRYAVVLAAGRPVTLLCNCDDHAATNCPLDVVAEAISAVAQQPGRCGPTDDLLPTAEVTESSSRAPDHQPIVRRGIRWHHDLPGEPVVPLPAQPTRPSDPLPASQDDQPVVRRGMP